MRIYDRFIGKINDQTNADCEIFDLKNFPVQM